MSDTVLLMVAAAFGVFCLLALGMLLPLLRTSAQERRIQKLVQASPKPASTRRKAAYFFRSLLLWVRKRGGLPAGQDLRKRMVAAGLRADWQTDLFLAMRILCPLAGAAMGSLAPENPMLWVVLLGIIGYMLPDFWLSSAIRRYRERIRLSLADALDLLVISVEAGLGLDQAIQRVGQELAISHPAISAELGQITFEQRAGKPRLDAWKNMSARTKVEEVEAFVSMLAQTDRFGTPIAKSLSVFAEGLRTKRRLRAEELAAKTAIKMIFPLVLFIFPSMFIVLLGPAVLSVMHNLSGMFD